MITCLLIILVVVLLAWLAAPLYYNKRVRKKIERAKYLWAFDGIPVNEMRRLLQRHEPKEWISTNEERKFYDELPDDVVLLYRGGSIDEAISGEYGISWTTSRPVAEFFAFRHGIDGQAVFCTVVPKSKIRAVFTEQEEKECLLIEPTNVEIVTTEPAEYYDHYQKFRADYDRQKKELLAKIKKQWSDLSKNEQKKFDGCTRFCERSAPKYPPYPF